MTDDSRFFSQRLGLISTGQLQAALDRFDLGRLVDAEPAPGGLFGQNLFLRSTSGAWVLRGAPHYDGQFEKERFFSRLVHERTEAEAPWPFLIERSDEPFGWHFAMMPRLLGVDPGSPDIQQSLTRDQRIRLAGAMGAYLAKMQSWTAPACATYDHATDDLAAFEEPYAEWFARNARDWLHRCLSGSWDLGARVDRAKSKSTTDADVEWIETVIDRARDALKVPLAPVIVHTDYKENNTSAELIDDAWHFTGLFDLGEAYIGDGEYDLARSACSYAELGEDVLSAFVEQYLTRRPSRAGFRERMRLYILCDRLIIWEYGQRNGVWFSPEQTFRAWAEPMVDMPLPG